MVSNTVWGYITVAAAVFCFGSFALPLKYTNNSGVDPVVLQCYFTVSVFVSSWLVLTYNEFAFTTWGIAGAVTTTTVGPNATIVIVTCYACWVPSSLLSFVAIRHAGIALSQAVWSGSTIIVSFLWGAAYLQEAIDSLPLAVLGIVVLIVGITGVSLCNLQFPVALPPSLSWLYRLNWLCAPFPEPLQLSEDSKAQAQDQQQKRIFSSTEEEDVSYQHSLDKGSLVESGTISEASLNSDLTNKVVLSTESLLVRGENNHAANMRDWIIGIGSALLLGLANGTMMVPTTLSSLQGISYIISFSIGVVIITAFFLVVDLLYTGLRYRHLPIFAVREVAIPGMVAGLIWNLGNFFSIYATQFLGLTIGFPLTQTALLVGALWGMLLFREITRLAAVTQFFVSALVLLGGAALLSIFG